MTATSFVCRNKTRMPLYCGQIVDAKKRKVIYLYCCKLEVQCHEKKVCPCRRPGRGAGAAAVQLRRRIPLPRPGTKQNNNYQTNTILCSRSFCKKQKMFRLENDPSTLSLGRNCVYIHFITANRKYKTKNLAWKMFGFSCQFPVICRYKYRDRPGFVCYAFSVRHFLTPLQTNSPISILSFLWDWSRMDTKRRLSSKRT